MSPRKARLEQSFLRLVKLPGLLCFKDTARVFVLKAGGGSDKCFILIRRDGLRDANGGVGARPGSGFGQMRPRFWSHDTAVVRRCTAVDNLLTGGYGGSVQATGCHLALIGHRYPNEGISNWLQWVHKAVRGSLGFAYLPFSLLPLPQLPLHKLESTSMVCAAA